jgi:hypothetical protein
MPMKRTRQVLVLTLVATALCADRVVTAAPAMRAQLTPSADPIARLASHLGGKLSGTFRRVMPAVRLSYSSREAAPAARPTIPPALLPPVLHLAQGSPFQFRLPPPSL